MLTSSAEQKIIKCKLSRMQFPEICPVCLGKTDDYFQVKVNEKEVHADLYFSRYASIYTKPTGIPYPSLKSQSSVIFSIPVCKDHMNRRTFSTALTGINGFFLFFYPLLFSLLLISNDLHYGGDLLFDSLLFLFFAGITSALLVYGLFPRSIERAIFIERANRGEDLVFLRISNSTYLERFMELNNMFAEIITKKEFEDLEQDQNENSSNGSSSARASAR